MTYQSTNIQLERIEESRFRNLSKLSNEVHTPFFGRDNSTFHDNELLNYCGYNITYSMSQLRLEDQISDNRSNVSNNRTDIDKHLSSMSAGKPELAIVQIVDNIILKLPIFDKNNEIYLNNFQYENKTISKIRKQKRRENNIKNQCRVYRTNYKSLQFRKSSLKKQESGLSLIMGRKYSKSNSSIMGIYLSKVFNNTRIGGFKFDTPSPDELAIYRPCIKKNMW